MKKFLLLAAALLAATSMTAEQKEYVLNLNNPVSPATINFNENNYWEGTYDETVNELKFSPFVFSHLPGGEGSSWGGYYWEGFTLSKSTDITDYSASGSTGSFLTNFGNAITGGAVATDADGSIIRNADGTAQAAPGAPYLVAYWGGVYSTTPSCTLTFDTPNEQGKLSYEMRGLYITNNCWPYYSFFHGDGFARAFDQEGDAFNCIATGYDAEGNVTGTSTFTLASFANNELNAVNGWAWWNLAELGEVAKVEFSLTSTDIGAYGMNTACYFCMDKVIVAEPELTAIDDATISRTVSAVDYVNLAGQRSAEPFDGVNVVITHYTDGTTSTAKVMR